MNTIEILKYCSNLELGKIKDFLSSFDKRYGEGFSPEEICRHIKTTESLSKDEPVSVECSEGKSPKEVDVTVIAYDFPFVFSMITGVLSSSGMDITQGEIFTQRKKGKRVQRFIIDRFKGYLREERNLADWTLQLRFSFKEIFRKLIKDNDPASAKEYVNERVARVLYQIKPEKSRILYPIEIEFDNSDENYTRMIVHTEDTPFFLYAMGTALSMQAISIENVSISTEEHRVEDEFLFVTMDGKKITGKMELDRIKLSVLLTKQFTYFLSQSPSPYSALLRFEELLKRILLLPEKGKLLEMLSDVDTLKYLARLLGISDFLWEDFIRLQYESLIPMLKPQMGLASFSEPIEKLCESLKKKLATVPDTEGLAGKERALNDYKDRQIFLMDLNHILLEDWDLKKLSLNLTRLAECVISCAFNLAYEELIKEYGSPKTVAGLDARYAILGLGKLGGIALGYASDIEILFIYSDQGKTDGKRQIDNSEFFEELVKKATRLIHAKREGIFHIDLRLRPYGSAGPLACSLARFCNYYGRGGKSHSYERLALVRLRFVGGDEEFGKMIERLRDEIVYTEGTIEVGEIRELREKQYREKCPGGKLNAKFSPGALVDLEYAVQILQVIHGSHNVELRTPILGDALDRMVAADILERDEVTRLIEAYYFLRSLINALRMLRGSARDLFLPQPSSREYEHLARRMGYRDQNGITASQNLHVEFETKTAIIREFLTKYFGKDSIPGKGYGNIADLVLSDSVREETISNILKGIGFNNIKRAYGNLVALAGSGSRRDIFAKLAVLAGDMLKRIADPDLSLNNWERFVRVLKNKEGHFKILLSQPRRLDLMIKIFSDSEYLANTLIRNPDFFEWVTAPENMVKVRKKEIIIKDFKKVLSSALDEGTWMNLLRLYKKREILRIGTRDLCLNKPIEEIMLELSELAEACIELSLERACGGKYQSNNLSVLAFGKLGGGELNYSSDIDLFFVYDDTAGNEIDSESLSRIVQNARSYLSSHTEEGYAYRVDLRLRPYGSSGELVQPVSSVVEYFRKHAREWEIQALIKLRAVGGNIELGNSIISVLKKLAFERFDNTRLVESIKKLRLEGEKKSEMQVDSSIDVKTGRGGIRDIEFMVQGLQLITLRDKPEMIYGNTLLAIRHFKETGLLPKGEAEELEDLYIFLRRVEHYLQIYGDRQKHTITRADLTGLARRLMGREVNDETFVSDILQRMNRVRELYTRYFSQV